MKIPPHPLFLSLRVVSVFAVIFVSYICAVIAYTTSSVLHIFAHV